MDLRRALGALGRTLIGAGVLILLFVAYQLWGTGFSESRSQDRLKEEFEAAPAPPPGEAPAPPPEGEAVAIIKIPKIGVEKAVVEGVGVADLKKGPGHYPGTPMPGQKGNASIAGHRTTYGAPFYRLDEMAAGDPILVTTREGDFRYEVTELKVVTPRQTEVLAETADSRLTLTTCNPRFSAKERLIVVASLTGPARPAAAGAKRGKTETEISGLSGDPAARGPVIVWGLTAFAVGLLTWIFATYWRRWPSYLVGAPIFLVVLFVFYENVARLLPANV